jgi:hypothetical protein
MLMVFLLLGGSFTVGQLVLSEIGRYEIWSRKKRFVLGSSVGALTFLASFAFLLFFEEEAYPFFIFGLAVAEKAVAKGLNRLAPDRFQAGREELRQKYKDAFRVEDPEVEEIIRGEEEFLRKLGLLTAFEEEPQGRDVKAELKELRRAIKRFIEREKDEGP